MTGAIEQENFEELLREVLRRVHGVLDEQARWELLLEAVVTMAADLSLDGLLEHIVGIAGQLAGARYAALGVLDTGSGRRLRTFVHHGIDAEGAATIGELPSGHGLLGLIIDRPEPLRLHDIAEHAASYGFPADHPPMHSFLGVPVRIRDRVFGNLYLTEKQGGGEFTAEDERIVVALAAAAGVAVENAQLYEEARRRELWLSATAEITGLLSGPVHGTEALQVVVDRALEVSGASAVWLLTDGVGAERRTGPGVEPMSVRVAAETGAASPAPVSSEVAEQVASGGVPRRVENSLLVPFAAAGAGAGVLVLHWAQGGQNGQAAEDLDPALPASFAEQAALALRVASSHRDREQLAVFEDRDRIGRDLHDVIIQRLFAIGLSLQGSSRLADDPVLRERLEGAVDELDSTIKNIRSTIFELGGSSDDVQAEVTRLVRRAAETLGFRPSLAFEGPVRTRIGADVVPDLLAVLTEALSNVARHSGAARVSVLLSARDADLVLEVVDDGCGVPSHVDESGLHNMRERARARGGTLHVEPAAGGGDGSAPAGTRLRWQVPLG